MMSSNSVLSANLRALEHKRWLAVSALVVIAAAITLLPGGWRYQIDVDVYWQGAADFWRTGEIYNHGFETRFMGLPFTYPPFGALVFTPLWGLVELVGYTAAEMALTLVSIVALWWVADRILVWTGGHSTNRSLWLLAAMLLAEPVISTLHFGQINIVLMALVITDVAPRPRWLQWLPRGILTGIAAAIKLTPAVFGLYFLLRLDWKGVAGVIGGFLAAVALAALPRPGTTWQYFTDVLFSTDRIGVSWDATNVSVQGMLSRFTESQLPWLILVIMVLLLGSAAAAAAFRKDQHLLALGLIGMISLLCSPVSWSHHWVWLIPLTYALFLAGHRWLAVWGILAQTVGAFHKIIPRGDNVELTWSPVFHVLGAHFLIFAVVAMLVVLYSGRNKTTGAAAPEGALNAPGGSVDGTGDAGRPRLPSAATEPAPEP